MESEERKRHFEGERRTVARSVDSRVRSLVYREGTVQVGDRLVSVNGQTVHGLTLAQAQKIIRDSNEK